MEPPPAFPVSRLQQRDWRNGVLVRMPNWLGDAVMAFPALVQLKKIIPEHCGLFVVCPPGLVELFETMPLVDRVIGLHQAHRMWNRRDIRQINRIQAGVGLMFNNSLRDALGFRLARVPRLFGAAARGRSLLLTRSFRFPPRRDAHLNHLHHCEKYLSLVYALGAPAWRGEVPAFHIAPEKLVAVAPDVRLALDAPYLLTLAAGAAYGGSKRWPATHFNQVARGWIAQGGNVAVLGSAGERTIGTEVLSDLPAEHAFNLAGKTSFSALLALLQHAAFCVANDSGIMHLSAALGGSGLAVFGPTDPSATCPISSRWSVVFEKQPCSPCFKRECPDGDARCMTAIPASQVIQRMQRQLEDGF